jgi:hypothetical protein
MNLRVSRRSPWIVAAIGLGLPAVSCGSDETASGYYGPSAFDGGDADASVSDVPWFETSIDGIVQLDQWQQDQTQEQGCPGGCAENQVCSHGTCVVTTGCSSDNDCKNDTYCVGGSGCVPWGTPPDKTHDPACMYLIPPGILAPKIRCEFSEPPTNDPFPDHRDVQAVPTVVNFHKSPSAGPPSIVVPFTDSTVQPYTETQGIIRILRGTDCEQEAVLGGTDLDADGEVDWIRSPATLALGDLDLDGTADVVAYGADNSTLAFTLKNGTWSLLWKARNSAGGPVLISTIVGAWAGPSIHDLDDDGKPEVIREGYVISNEGVMLSAPPANYATYSFGLNATLANIDDDPSIELMNGAFVWQWHNGAWEQDAAYTGPGAGHVAVADFGPYGTGGATAPEIAIVRQNTLTIVTPQAAVVFGPIHLPPGDDTTAGGPPTIADYDGDGLPEVGVAGSDFYSVFDIDCGPQPRAGGTCAATNRCDNASGVPGACPQGVLWSRKTQDHSSNVTGSSVFDFEADGPAEVVYADECFARVYRGSDGEVLFSQYHSSCTWYENPVVADVDGNFRADLIVPSNIACQSTVFCAYNAADPANSSLDSQLVDKEFVGLRCEQPSDCISGQCDQGLCRCTASAQCCTQAVDAQCEEFGYKCAAPPAGTPGAGNTCRASHPHKVSGVRVYSDIADKWVRSRTIWSQHAYAVTHINEDGTVPKTSAWLNNWEQPGLNNFRQNVPGTANGQLTPDPTVGAATFPPCTESSAELKVAVCNRGADSVAPGLSVGFYDGATLVCSATTKQSLEPGQCESVSCTWDTPPTTESTAKDITVKVNNDHKATECKEGNDEGTIAAVFCRKIG